MSSAKTPPSADRPAIWAIGLLGLSVAVTLTGLALLGFEVGLY